MFISPLFDLIDLTSYADDNYIIESDLSLDRSLAKVKMKTETAIDWLKNAGMKVNESKTVLCIFYHKDVLTRTITLQQSTIKSTKTIKVLGVIFDCKMDWKTHVSHVISKCRNTVYALKQIRLYFNQDEFLNIVNSMFYSKLYYACQIWLSPSLNATLKQRLFSISSKALQIIAGNDFDLFSFKELHILFSRATPSEWSNYACANLMYSIINNKCPISMWIRLQEKIRINERTDKFTFEKSNVRKVGLNCFSNRLSQISSELCFTEMNLSKDSFKVLCKKKFLP
jgi:hypothetical protein